MQTIYVVTSGQYSDYGIEAIFSNKENAERYSKEYNKTTTDSDMSELEEWVMDDPENDELVSKTVWIISIRKDDGRIDCKPYETKILTNKNKKSLAYEYPNHFYIHSFISSEHATKLASEKYQQYLREHAIGLS